jgi:hypothetical protein
MSVLGRPSHPISMLSFRPSHARRALILSACDLKVPTIQSSFTAHLLSGNSDSQNPPTQPDRPDTARSSCGPHVALQPRRTKQRPGHPIQRTSGAPRHHLPQLSILAADIKL